MRHSSLGSILMIVFASIVHSQTESTSSNQTGCEIWGQLVVAGNSISEDSMSIELAGKDVRRQRAPIVNGNFNFRAVPAGNYQLRVLDHSNHVMLSRTRFLTGTNDHIMLVSPLVSPESHSLHNTISFRELHHQTAPKARDAFRRAIKAADVGDGPKSIEFLSKALEIDPEFAEAEVNLGVQYLEAGQIPVALTHFQRGFELSPESPEAGYNLAMLLVHEKAYEQAESVARHMLRNQQAVSGMHAVLAVTLIRQNRNLEEAHDHLRRAVAEFPMARLLAAHAFFETKRFSAAATQVREYLRTSAHVCEREKLESWLSTFEASRPNLAAVQDK